MTTRYISDPAWNDVRAEFEPDGSWRDIYALQTDIGVWQDVLDWIRQRDPSPRYTVDGELASLPASAESIFGVREHAAPSLQFRIRGIDLATHFFDQGDVELDFDPRAVRGDNWSDFVAAVAEFSATVRRDVIITPENLPQVVILRISPTQVRYHPGDPP